MIPEFVTQNAMDSGKNRKETVLRRLIIYTGIIRDSAPSN